MVTGNMVGDDFLFQSEKKNKGLVKFWEKSKERFAEKLGRFGIMVW